jgi:NDP-sugar pyrophosphorylase family protein
MAKMFLDSGKLGLISVYDNSKRIANNNIVVDQKGFVQKYDKYQETPDMNGVEAGAMVFSKNVLDLMPEVSALGPEEKVSLEIDVYPKLINQNQLLGYLTPIRFYDMGTFDRIETISEVLK